MMEMKLLAGTLSLSPRHYGSNLRIPRRSPKESIRRLYDPDSSFRNACRSPDAPDHSQSLSWRPLPYLSRQAVRFNSTLIGTAHNILNTLHLEAHLTDAAPALSSGKKPAY
jgi:hypothetical protein